MKKTSSKIIIFLLLTLVLWGGVNFEVKKNDIRPIVEITKVHAQPAIGSETNESCDLYYPASTNPSGNSACRSRVAANRNANVEEVKENWWQKIRDGALSLGDIAGGLMKSSVTAPLIITLLIIHGILGVIMTIVAALFDASIHASIVGFKAFVDSTSIIDSWIIIRDIFNISFIFILLYIAITTIIGGAGVKTKVLVKDVIISAILINFSMFFTRIIIDGGNILATALYNKINTISWGGLGAAGLSGQIVNSLKLQNILKFKSMVTATGQANSIIMLVLSIIINCLAMWAFLYGAILFLLRNIMFLFLMATSPIGFMGGTIPWLKEKSGEWWSALLQQVAVAPFFLFMIFMLMNLIRGLKTPQTEWISIYLDGKSALNYTMFINAILIISMLLVGTKMTKKLAGKMGGVAEKMVGLAVTAAVTAATAGTAFFAAKGATIGASLAFRGAAKGGLTGALIKGAGKLSTGAGRVATVTNQIKGKVDGIINAPGIIGRNLTAGKKGLLSSIKKETGLDVDYASQFKADAKEDKKRTAEIANKKGAGEENEEIKNREATMENITARAEEQIDNDAKGTNLKEDLKNNADVAKGLTEKIAELTKTINNTATSPANKATAEAERELFKDKQEDVQRKMDAIKEEQENRQKAMIEGVKKEIGRGMGYDTDKHESDLAALRDKRRIKEKVRDEYIAGIKDPKIAAELRAIKGKWKDKSPADLLVEEAQKQAKEALEKETKKTT